MFDRFKFYDGFGGFVVDVPGLGRIAFVVENGLVEQAAEICNGADCRKQ